MAKQRLDGFVSVNVPHTGGWGTTPLITFDGNHLELNINVTAMGEAMVEIQDNQGRPIPGFLINECDRLLNDVSHPVTWQGNQDVSSLQGRTIRLHIAIKSANLYAFQFKNS